MICIKTETQGFILTVVLVYIRILRQSCGSECPASAKAVNVLAVRYVKQGTDAAGFRASSILYTLVNIKYVSIIYNHLLI